MKRQQKHPSTTTKSSSNSHRYWLRCWVWVAILVALVSLARISQILMVGIGKQHKWSGKHTEAITISNSEYVDIGKSSQKTATLMPTAKPVNLSSIEPDGKEIFSGVHN